MTGWGLRLAAVIALGMVYAGCHKLADYQPGATPDAGAGDALAVDTAALDGSRPDVERADVTVADGAVPDDSAPDGPVDDTNWRLVLQTGFEPGELDGGLPPEYWPTDRTGIASVPGAGASGNSALVLEARNGAATMVYYSAYDGLDAGPPPKAMVRVRFSVKVDDLVLERSSSFADPVHIHLMSGNTPWVTARVTPTDGGPLIQQHIGAGTDAGPQPVGSPVSLPPGWNRIQVKARIPSDTDTADGWSELWLNGNTRIGRLDQLAFAYHRHLVFEFGIADAEGNYRSGSVAVDDISISVFP